jgi:sugar lactone lactonase YvrE
MQAVPTTIVANPDGGFYMGQLTGFPFPSGAANVYMVTQDGASSVFLDGFTNISDIALDGDGNLWVLEIAANTLLAEAPAGALTRVSPDGTREVVISEGLIMPTDVTVGPDGDIYITNCDVCPGGGQVLKMSLAVAEPDPPATGDYSVTPLMGSLVVVFGILLMISGGLVIKRRGIRA